MWVIGFAGVNEIGGLHFAESELFSGNGATEQLVDKPEPVCVENVTLAVLGDIGYTARLDHRVNCAAIDPVRLPWQAKDLANLVELDLGSEDVGSEHITQVST